MKRKFTISGLVVLVITVASAFLVWDTHPVLIRMPFELTPRNGRSQSRALTLFWDRSPERTAGAYLEAMRRGDCADAERLSTHPELPNGWTCAQLENEWPNQRDLFVRPLSDRKESGGVVVLYYSGKCECGVEGNWVGVRRSSDGWRVVGFNRIW